MCHTKKGTNIDEKDIYISLLQQKLINKFMITGYIDYRVSIKVYYARK